MRVAHSELRAICRVSAFSAKTLDGGQGQNRTADTRIFNPLLYQLSYLAFLYGGWRSVTQGGPWPASGALKRRSGRASTEPIR